MKMIAGLMLNVKDGSFQVQNEDFVDTVVEMQVMVNTIDSE